MDTLLHCYVVGDFPGHLDSALSSLRTLFISFRDSNLPQTLPEDPPLHDLTLNNTKYLGSKCSTQTVRSFDGMIFYMKRFAIKSVEVVIKFSLLSLSEFQRGRNCFSHEEMFTTKMVKAQALWKPALLLLDQALDPKA